MSPRKVPELPRRIIWIDDKGRIVIPLYMREAMRLDVPGWVLIEMYPNMGDCKALFIKKR